MKRYNRCLYHVHFIAQTSFTIGPKFPVFSLGWKVQYFGVISQRVMFQPLYRCNNTIYPNASETINNKHKAVKKQKERLHKSMDPSKWTYAVGLHERLWTWLNKKCNSSELSKKNCLRASFGFLPALFSSIQKPLLKVDRGRRTCRCWHFGDQKKERW